MKNKKLLFTALLSVFVLGGAFAQTRWQSDAVIGQVLQAVNTANKDTLTMHFNTNKLTSAWAHARATASLGKDSISIFKATTVRGLQVKAFLDNTTTTAYEDGNFKCNNAGANGNPVHVYSVDSLKKILQKSIISGTFATINGHLNDSLTRPAACLFDVASGNQAFGMYPGKAKKIEYVFRFDYTGKACTDDISFQMNTYDAGTTGKTATYELAVYKSSTFSEANRIGNVVSNVYTTGQGLKSINVASEIGLTPADFTNKSLYIVVKTLGTSNASNVVDALPNPVDASNLPVATDPIVVFDNFFLTYASASWVAPAGAVASAVINHNNGAPIVTTSTDWTGGTPVPVYVGIDNPVKFYITGINRIQNLNIKEANDGGGHSAKYSSTATGAIKKKAADGAYSQDVTYTYVPYDGVTNMIFSLDIPAPATGSVNDTLEVAIVASNIASGMSSTVRLEITNGVRFWYNIAVTGSLATGANTIDLNKMIVRSENKSIFVLNNNEDVLITNISGQKVKVASALQAAQGISVPTGIYVVRSGKTIQKVIVQ